MISYIDSFCRMSLCRGNTGLHGISLRCYLFVHVTYFSSELSVYIYNYLTLPMVFYSKSHINPSACATTKSTRWLPRASLAESKHCTLTKKVSVPDFTYLIDCLSPDVLNNGQPAALPFYTTISWQTSQAAQT